MAGSSNLVWWQRVVFYQVYPRSFADSNSDGIGDLPGIIAKLDYLADLGIGAIWLSPHYPSPQFDCGYDVSDYARVAPEYGTLEDFERLLAEAHRRGIRVITDLVLNHSSHLHPWFIESRSSRDNPKRDWYVWRDGRDGGPPNDWISTFGGPAWTHDALTDQYYYHYFFKEQPDLNWRNPEVKQAMFDAVCFWLDLGVDGFRLDAIATIFEEPGYPDQGTGLSLVDLRLREVMGSPQVGREQTRPLWRSVFGHQRDLPGVHDLMKELRCLVDAYPDRVLVGESDDLAYYGSGEDELHLVFNFSLMRQERLTADGVRQNQTERLAALPRGAWPCNTMGNHDTPRVRNRMGDGIHDDAQARAALALILCLPGTPFLYNGEEIGMVDLLLDDIGQFRDRLGNWAYEALIGELGMDAAAAVRIAGLNSRDGCRTPMQWSGEANGGFCPAEIEPWLPVHPNHAQGVNVADQDHDPSSMLAYYRRFLRLRRHTPALVEGEFRLLDVGPEGPLAFLRWTQDQRCLVMINLTADRVQLDALPEVANSPRVVLGTHREAGKALGLSLEPYEVTVCLA